MKGWVKVDRSLLEHPIWTCDEFSRGQAWVDLILLANHEDKEVMVNGRLIMIPAGAFLTSAQKLSIRWKWSRSKVQRFLEMLQNANMIRTENRANNGSMIFLINYGKFQGGRAGNRADNEPKTSRRRADGEHKQEYIKNDKEYKNARTRGNRFNDNFESRTYDYDALEAAMLKAQYGG